MLGKSKILDYERQWYDEIDGTSFYEKDLEKTILDKVPNVYPDYFAIPFSKTIWSGAEKSRPDLALIRKDYSHWYIIEVEMKRHGWEDHVEKQVRVFSRGLYEKNAITDYIIRKDVEYSSQIGEDPRLDRDSVLRLVDEEQPKVMVIVNEPAPEWLSGIRKYGAELSVFQMYRGTEGLEVYRVEGDTPFVFRDKSHARLFHGVSNVIIVYTPTFISEEHGEELEIVFRGRKTAWIRQDDGDKTFLVLKGSTSYLQTEKEYVLYISESGEYYLEFN